MAPYWLFQLQLFPWLPFLIYQAKKIRKSSPKLPAQSPLLTLGQGEKHVVLLGESTVAGVGASSASTTLAGNFSRIFGNSYQIEAIGKKGLRVKEAFSLYLKHKNSERKKSEGVLLFLGANDCFLLTSPQEFKKELESLIQQIQVATGAEWIYLAAIPPVHLFPAFSEQMRSFLYRQRNYLLLEIEAIAARKPQVIFHQIPMDLQPEFFSADGVHPSDLGYQKIAELAIEKMKI
jgi:lysophospholipase L1-like esterase